MANKVNLDVSERLDIICRQGDTFSLTLTLKDSAGDALPLSTDNYRFAMQVRSDQDSARAKGSSGLILGTRDIGSRATNAKGQESSFETFTVDDSGNLTITGSAKVKKNTWVQLHTSLDWGTNIGGNATSRTLSVRPPTLP